MRNFIRIIFYGNIFYGFCTVALSIESNLQHGISLNSIRFYILAFLATALFYSRIYFKSSAIINVDDRTDWYRRHRTAIKLALTIGVIAFIADVLLMAFINRKVLYHLSAYYWSLLAVVPLFGVMYSYEILPITKLRKVGWLKPFVIGFVWAGLVTIFPVLFWQLRHQGELGPNIIIKIILWLQNFLFISTLAIVFDIKDYKADKKHKLNTYPTAFGITTTINYIIIPLNILSALVLLMFQLKYHASQWQIIIQALPYLALLLLSKSLAKERSLLFYLAIIDGLMLLKGLCGIISIIWL